MSRFAVPLLLCASLIQSSCQRTGENPVGPDPPVTARDDIVFISNRETGEHRFQIFLMNDDGSCVRRLTHDSLNYFAPRFSPDGSHILSVSQSLTDAEIMLIDVATGVSTDLSRSPGNDRLPEFSPDGSRIAFTSDRDGNREIYIMNRDGSGQRRLTGNAATDDAPQFSPDGTTIIFFATTYDPTNLTRPESYDLFRINVDGTGLIQLTPDSTYGHFSVRDDSPSVFDATPRYSPDGTRIVFQTYRDDNWVINLMSADGSDRRQIVGNPGGNFAPFFFAGGGEILFRSHRTGDFDLFRMALDAEAPQIQITSDNGHTLFGDFTDDGSRILYASNIDEERYEYYHIYRSDADGGNRVKLTHGNFADYYPDFRPGR